jgi:hypothetical protein
MHVLMLWLDTLEQVSKGWPTKALKMQHHTHIHTKQFRGVQQPRRHALSALGWVYCQRVYVRHQRRVAGQWGRQQRQRLRT